MKLTERLSKDPKSKLFVPLAEEYKKAGDIETAIAVLTEGLKNNPGYVTAKSFLGRLFLDKGDLSEARKEFEEVIKAIPDNVMAQRKLGDIHVLQGRAREALHFFKAVLTVNPKDPELNALIADIEAGRDIRDRISGPRLQPAAAAGTTPASVSTPGAPPSAPSTPAAKPSSAPGIPLPPKAQAAPVRVPPAPHAEEPEEVLVFESLDEAAPVPDAALQRPESTQDMRDFFAEPAAEKTHEDAVRMDDGVAGGEREPAPMDIPLPGSGAFDAAAVPDGAAPIAEPEPRAPEFGLPDNAFFDSEPLQVEPKNTIFETEIANESVREVAEGESTGTAPAEDLASEALLFDVEPVEEAQPSPPGNDRDLDGAAAGDAASFRETLPEADDFTTDTLAELYIAQGFYEKAIEIYERMLADKPNSKLLRDKLANVRAMGSASGAEEEQGTPVLFEEPGSLPVQSQQQVAADGARQRNVPGAEGEAKEYTPPPADDFESTAFDAGFAPVEYVQPEEPASLPSSPADRGAGQEEEAASALLNTAASEKEQTIARLDTWLKNIQKEK